MEDSERTVGTPLDLALLHRLDACRPGSDDAAQLLTDEDRRRLVTDPQYVDWQRRSAAFDSAVSHAYADSVGASIPVGLADRLQAALMAAANPTTIDESTADSPALPQPSRLNRRHWLAAAGSALTATAAGWAALSWWRGREREAVTREELLDEVLAMHRQTAERRGLAVGLSHRRAPAEFPLSSHVVTEAGLRWEPHWQSLEAPLAGRSGIAYELAPPAAPRAVLYVLNIRGERGAPELPPLATDASQPPSTTGGCSLGAWREGDRLYILAVDGDERRYRSFIERPHDVA